MTDVAPESFATPDDLGDLHASELHTSLGESLAAQGEQAFMGGTRTLTQASQMMGAKYGVDPLWAASTIDDPAGQQFYNEAMAEQRAKPDVPLAAAQARIKQEGLEGKLKLPEQEAIRQPVLDLMIAHAHERADYDAAVNRGPQNFAAGALGFVTQMGLGMIDPVNAAAFSIPVLGEARYGQMVARAGESLANRFAVKAGVGAAQGAVGGAALLPADWWLHTQDGQDFTMADALKSVVLSAGMGAAFMGAHGTVSDLLARYRGLPLSGSPTDLLVRGLTRPGPAVAQPIIPLEEVPGITAAEKPLARPPEGQPEPEGPKGVFDDVLEQLRAAGMGDEEAQQNAAVVAARYEARADRLGDGRDAYELYRGEGLTVQRPPDEEAELEGRVYGQGAISPEYEAALAAHSNAFAEFQRVTHDYRERRIGDQEFLAARAKYDEAQKAFDAAYAAEEARPPARAPAPAAEPGLFSEREAEGQQVLPGAERIGQGELAQRRAEQPLKPKAAQKPMDIGLFGDEANQKTLFQAPTFYSSAEHALDVTPQLRDAAVRQGFPLFQAGEQAPRGRITLQQNRAVVDLFKNADRSTFMHEAGHLWLEEMVRDAGADNAPEGVRNDLATILSWLGVEKPEQIGTEQHEQWARGFEQYLAEGKAPSSRLAQAFGKFKDWLIAIYHGLSSFGAPLSDDVRGVMDRMLATDKEIADFRNAPPHPAEVLADLPPAVQENVVQAAIADIINGRPVRAAEMLNEAGKQDPRIAESLNKQPPEPLPPAARRGPRSRDPSTYSLLEFLAAHGGIRNDDAQVADLRTSFGRDNKFVPGFGNLIRNPRELSTAARNGGARRPMSLDQAREAAVEAGYLHDEGRHNGGESTSTIEQLLQAIDQEARGRRVYRGDQNPTGEAEANRIIEENQRHAEDELDVELRGIGEDPQNIPAARRARVLEIMAREGQSDPLEAWVQAVMEEDRSGVEAGQVEPPSEKIPGWDDDGSTASETGGRTAQEPIGEGAGDRAGPRAGGANDRAARQARNVEAWKKFAEPAGAAEDPDLAVASHTAEKAPEPPSVDVVKAPSAAQAAASEADKLLADILPQLTDDERKVFEDALNQMDMDNDAREQICRDGAECLAAAAAGAAAA